MDAVPERYDDIIKRDHAEGADLELMDRGCHFDYSAQEWRDGHDHAHYAMGDDSLPLLFCGASLGSCVVAKAIIAECEAV